MLGDVHHFAAIADRANIRALVQRSSQYFTTARTILHMEKYSPGGDRRWKLMTLSSGEHFRFPCAVMSVMVSVEPSFQLSGSQRVSLADLTRRG